MKSFQLAVALTAFSSALEIEDREKGNTVFSFNFQELTLAETERIPIELDTGLAQVETEIGVEAECPGNCGYHNHCGCQNHCNNGCGCQ